MVFSFVAGYLGGQRAMVRAVRAASAQGATAGLRVDPLEELSARVDRMGILIEAMWELLAEHDLSEEDLATAVDRVAARRLKPEPSTCPQCGSRTTSHRCQICGAETGQPPAIEGL